MLLISFLHLAVSDSQGSLEGIKIGLVIGALFWVSSMLMFPSGWQSQSVLFI